MASRPRVPQSIIRWVAVMALLGSPVVPRAFDVDLSPLDLNDAVDLGRTALEARRTEYHRPYRLAIGSPPLDYVEVITPFRRVVLAAEARLRAGERLFGQREALAVLGTSPEAVDIRLELTFHPQNTFVGVPLYAVRLRAPGDGREIEPQSVERTPRFGPRVEGVPVLSPTQGAGIARGRTQPLLGGTIVATFDGHRIVARGRYVVEILEGQTVLASGTLDFSSLR